MLLDIRFKNNGLDSIEVQDNGDGISPENYETVGASMLYPHLQRSSPFPAV
jgi:DNA mismatch repair ATPase MutL